MASTASRNREKAFDQAATENPLVRQVFNALNEINPALKRSQIDLESASFIDRIGNSDPEGEEDVDPRTDELERVFTIHTGVPVELSELASVPSYRALVDLVQEKLGQAPNAA